jgi:hypothetical protein
MDGARNEKFLLSSMLDMSQNISPFVASREPFSASGYLLGLTVSSNILV